MKNRSFEVLCHEQIRNARSKDVRTGWRRNMIRITYLDRICHRSGVIFHERYVLQLGGIWMELIRIALRTPCHPGERSLYLAHADGPPCGIAQSTRGGIPCADISHPEFRAPTFYIRISHNRMQTFQLLLSDISRSSHSAYQESFSLSIQCHSVLLKLPDIFDRHSEIFWDILL